MHRNAEMLSFLTQLCTYSMVRWNKKFNVFFVKLNEYWKKFFLVLSCTGLKKFFHGLKSNRSVISVHFSLFSTYQPKYIDFFQSVTMFRFCLTLAYTVDALSRAKSAPNARTAETKAWSHCLSASFCLEIIVQYVGNFRWHERESRYKLDLSRLTNIHSNVTIIGIVTFIQHYSWRTWSKLTKESLSLNDSGWYSPQEVTSSAFHIQSTNCWWFFLLIFWFCGNKTLARKRLRSLETPLDLML